jgi:hypothetical protein
MKQPPFIIRVQLAALVFEDDVNERSWLQYGAFAKILLNFEATLGLASHLRVADSLAASAAVHHQASLCSIASSFLSRPVTMSFALGAGGTSLLLQIRRAAARFGA